MQTATLDSGLRELRRRLELLEGAARVAPEPSDTGGGARGRSGAKAITYSIYEAERITSLPRKTLYAAAAQGRLRMSKCRRRTLVWADSLQEFLCSLPPADIQVPSLRDREIATVA
jgi:hypothetical protein